MPSPNCTTRNTWAASSWSAAPRPPTNAAARNASSVSLSNKLPIIVAGPTGVGKTAFAVELALQLDGEILGADAYQVYAGLEILTAQPDAATQGRVPHHLIGFLPPSEPFNAAEYAALAREKIAEVQRRGKRPILVGGSGLYLKALTHGLVALPDVDPRLRDELNALPPEEAAHRLKRADPTAREHIDFRNHRRVLRALEIHLLTGKLPGELREEWKDKAAPDFAGILLTRDRAELDARIAGNVAAMFPRVLDEVRALGEVGLTASRTLGLLEVQAVVRGEMHKPEAIAAITLATRRYAKRQLTWFRNQFIFPSIDLTGLQHTPEILPSALLLPGIV